MRRQGGKLLPCAVLALCLAALGTGYAYWDGTLRVAGKLATGQLDCAFASEGIYRAELVRDGGEVLAEIPMEARAGEDEKSIALVFPEGMPDDFLGGESYLRISCPIEEKGLKAKEQAADFTVPGEEILLTPEQVYLALPDVAYDWDEPDDCFLEPKRLIAFRSVERLDDVLCCCLYLRAENEKSEGVMPDFIRVDEESLMALPLAERLFPSSGVWVDYSFATELRIDQQTAGSGKRIHLFGALTTYAYWTDCLRVKGNAAFHFPVAVQLLEAGKFPADGAVIDDRGVATESNARKNGKTEQNQSTAGRTGGL